MNKTNCEIGRNMTSKYAMTSDVRHCKRGSASLIVLIALDLTGGITRELWYNKKF